MGKRALKHLLLGLLLATPGLAFAEGTGSACGSLEPGEEDVADHCAHFDLTSGLRGDAKAKAAKAACLVFYRKAYEGRELLCKYRVEALSFGLAANSAASENSGNARDAILLASDNSARAREIYRDYSARMSKKLEELFAAVDPYDRSLNEMMNMGINCAVSERRHRACKESNVPGILLHGMARGSFVQSNVIMQNVGGALQFMSENLSERAKGANAEATALYDKGGDLNSLVALPAPTNHVGEHENIKPPPLEAPGIMKPEDMRGFLQSKSLKTAAKTQLEGFAQKLAQGKDVSIEDLMRVGWKLACRRKLQCWLAEQLYQQAERDAARYRNFCRTQVERNQEISSAEMAAAWQAHKE